MKSLCSALAIAMALPTVSLAAQLNRAERAVPGQYIVVLKQDLVRMGNERNARPDVAAVAVDMAATYGLDVQFAYSHALPGFVVQANAKQLDRLLADGRVDFIEEDGYVSINATQTGATWGLDRTDQRDLPLNGNYVYDTTASNVNAYIVDTGVLSTHAQFSGRMGTGYTAISDGRGTSDCNGHGTHVAGTVAGSTHGIAKGARVFPVRVLGCNGSGTNAGVIAGMDWVAANHIKPAVANMSLGGGASTATDNAVTGMHNAGVVVVVAAGNDNGNACSYSPARAPLAITVGSTTNTDARSSFSNFGTCLDIYAPGSNITSAWYTSTTATNTISGTSMASPHVAGVAALYLANNPTATPAQVATAIINNSTPNKVTGAGTGSPNRLLYSIFGGGTTPVDNPPVANFTFSCTTLTCSFNGSGSTDDNGISSYSWTFGDGSTGTGATTSRSYAAAGTYSVVLTVRDTANQANSRTQSVTVTTGGGGGTAPCTNCEAYTGTLTGTGAQQFVPGGTYYYSTASGAHSGWLRGPASGTDFDLALQKWNGSSWANVATGTSSSSSETVTYNGTAGYYRWRVYSYSGSGSYSFWMRRP
jgi:serine protease